MNKQNKRVRGRHTPLIVWIVICTSPFLLANTCFDTGTAPDYVPAGADTGDADTGDTSATMVVAAPILPDSGG